MNYVTLSDGAKLFFKDWGSGQPVVFSHGWPLTADAWDPQMLVLGERGYRVIAHDRRGHGRSSQTWGGNNMDTYADDLAELLNRLDVRDIVLVGHSTGGGEVTRYIGRHGTDRVAKVVLVDAVPPCMVKSEKNPNGTPIEVFNEIRAGVLRNRSQYFKDFALPFYGFNREGAKFSQGIVDSFWRQCMQASIKGVYDCIEQFSETDFTEDLKAIDLPTLIAHGDDDQIVPIAASSILSAKIVQNAQLKIYPGGAHGLTALQADQFNKDLIDFIEEERSFEATRTEEQPHVM